MKERKEMNEKKNFGFGSRTYAAPRAESVAMNNGGLLCASPSDLEECVIQEFVIDEDLGLWEDPQP